MNVPPEEELSGGENFTTFDFGENAFGVQGSDLTREQSRFFVSGNTLFRTNWVEAPSSVMSLDGLGPVFNAISCGSCHFKDGRGAPFDEFAIARPGILWRVGVDGFDPRAGGVAHPIYGHQIQDRSLPGVAAEATIETSYEFINGSFADGTPFELRKPIYMPRNLGYGSLDDYQLSPRIATHLAGMGLLESIPEFDILQNADPEDNDGDGISGRPNYVHDHIGGGLQIGRFGWKANQPSILQQNAGAFNGDMGLTSSIFPKTDFTAVQTNRYPDLINGGEPEVSDQQLERITLYVKALSVPAKRNFNSPEYELGREIFSEIGCAGCHVPQFQTGPDPLIASLGNQTIFPYTDMLLHDMGEDLADNKIDFEATGLEWRTPPLWGIGLIKTVNGHTRFMHDGRARSIEEAILWHGGEGEVSKQNYINLSEEERQDLLLFLNSI